MTSTPARSYAPEIIVAAGCLIALITFGPRDFHAVLKAKFGLNDR